MNPRRAAGYGVDNREAMAYVIFRAMNCSRDLALRLVDEQTDLVPGIRRILRKKWRRPRRRPTKKERR